MAPPLLRHTSRIRVRYRDTDQMGVVHHAVYLEYFETGRTELLRRLGLPYSAMERDGVMLPLLGYGAEIRRPARYDDLVDVECAVTRPEGVRLRIDYRLLRDDELLVSGHTLHAFTTTAGMKPVRPPKSFLALFAEEPSVAGE